MATVQTRCKCGEFIRTRPDPGDWGEEERAYAGDEFTEHDCRAVEQLGDLGPAPQQVARRGPTRTRARREPVRAHRWTCACSPARIIRGSRDLEEIVCQRCSMPFCWSPSASELSDSELEGRRSA